MPIDSQQRNGRLIEALIRQVCAVAERRGASAVVVNKQVTSATSGVIGSWQYGKYFFDVSVDDGAPKLRLRLSGVPVKKFRCTFANGMSSRRRELFERFWCDINHLPPRR